MARPRLLFVVPQPGTELISQPAAPTQVPPQQPPVYAPVPLSGLTIAFDIASHSSFTPPAEVKKRDGERLAQLSLTCSGDATGSDTGGSGSGAAGAGSDGAGAGTGAAGGAVAPGARSPASAPQPAASAAAATRATPADVL